MEEFWWTLAEMSMAGGDETHNIAEVTAKILDAEKRALAESQVKLQVGFEVREAKFNADLEALATKRSQSPETSQSTASWLLARKCWAWLNRD
jgi:hypothetical protein